MSGGSTRGRLETVVRAAGRERRVIGVGWATVDLDRAATELARDLGIVPEDFVGAPESAALGARCRIAPGALGGDVTLVLLEPSTEGRLAGHLARHDEGPAVVWEVGQPAAMTPGPLGPELLQAAMPGRPDLLRLIVEQPPGTIQS